jgi:hypothetical protein
MSFYILSNKHAVSNLLTGAENKKIIDLIDGQNGKVIMYTTAETHSFQNKTSKTFYFGSFEFPQ